MPGSPSPETDYSKLEQEFLKRVKETFPKIDCDRIQEALKFTKDKHGHQTRESGEPYIIHPINVALILLELGMDADTIIAGLLHDVLEDTKTRPEELEKKFGKDITFLVESVTKIEKIKFNDSFNENRNVSKMYQRKVENYRKIIFSAAQDPRVLIIKLADRLHNVRTVHYLKEEKARRIVLETLEIYAPLAHRIGIWRIKWELEDLSFKYLNPKKYAELASKIKEKREDREKFLKLVESQLQQALKKKGIKAQIISRPKHIYSVYQKMRRKNKEFDELYDLYGIRIITETQHDAYEALGVVHELYKPVPGRFKDYIENPKPNFYQSLHTTVIGPDNKFIEIQIRSALMHEMAEFGIAAHWRYKEGRISTEERSKYLLWLNELINRYKDIKDPRDYYRFLRKELAIEDIYVLTPKGEIKVLKKHSTPIDFAYAVHTELGHRARGAKVNGKLVPLNYELKNGDVVEILTGNVASPSRDWLQFVKTSSARQKIKAFFRRKEREEKIQRGKEEFSRILKRLFPFDMDYQEVVNELLPEFKMKEENNFYISLTDGKLSLKLLKRTLLLKYAPEETQTGKEQVLKILEEQNVPENSRDTVLTKITRSLNMHAEEELFYAFVQKRISRKKLVSKIKKFLPHSRKANYGTKKPIVEVNNIKGLDIRFARCCIQLPGDEIVGIVTSSKVITIHRKSCTNVINYRGDRSRILPAYWVDESNFVKKVKLRIVAENLSGLNKFLEENGHEEMFGNYQIAPNIKGIYGGKFLADLNVSVRTREELEDVIRKLRSINGVVKVRAISGV